MKDNYILTCDGCDSKFEIICYDVTSYQSGPEFCPFCGCVIDEEDDNFDEDLEDSED